MHINKKYLLWILILIIAVLGVAFVTQSIAYKALEEKINTLNKILQAKNEEINYLKKCRH